MSRPVLSLAKPPAQPVGPSLSLVKKALRLYRGRGIDKATRRRNAMAWIAARTRMGEQHIFNASFMPRWGVPGDGQGVSQIHAPRRAKKG
jgi:hypothetical protein